MKHISQILKDSRYSNYREIINKRVEKVDLPKSKYNFPLLHDTEHLVEGFSGDRTEYDAGMEPELSNE